MIPVRGLALLALSVFTRSAIGAVFQDPSELKGTQYDFIVIGGRPFLVFAVSLWPDVSRRSGYCWERHCISSIGEPSLEGLGYRSW